MSDGKPGIRYNEDRKRSLVNLYQSGGKSQANVNGNKLLSKDLKKRVIGAGVLFLLSFALSVLTRTYIIYVEEIGNTYYSTHLWKIAIEQLMIPQTYLLMGIFMGIIVLFKFRGNAIGEWVYKYRFLIALVIFVTCVCLGLNGSSIGTYNELLLGQKDANLLLGTSRMIRFDEWVVQTPLALAQYQGENAFSYFSDIVRATSTDMFVIYGQATKNVLMIFRPFYWGYLVLPANNGIAFFWCGRIIALMLVSFEFGMVITNRRKSLSVIYMLMIVLAPVVQWWFAVNGLVEMLIMAQLSICLLYHYMNETSAWKRAIFSLGIVWSAGVYLLVFYPAWQIPLAYIVLGLAIWVIWDNRKKCKRTKIDYIAILLEIALLSLALVYFFTKSHDIIATTVSTVYPGERICTGGDGTNVFNYCMNIWYAMFDTCNETTSNVVECSAFISLFPVCLMPSIWNFLCDKKRDHLLIILFVLMIFLGIYVYVGFPEMIAKLTLLSKVPANRAKIAFQLCCIVMLLRGLSVAKKTMKWWVALVIAVFVTGLVMNNLYKNYQTYLGIVLWLMTAVAFFTIFLSVLQFGTKSGKIIFGVAITIVMLMSGTLVNPVRRGVDSVYKISIVQEMQDVAQKDQSGIWVFENTPVYCNNLGIISGAPTINSTNVYPDLSRWEILDPGKKNIDIYNRYSHISVEVADVDKAEFLLISPDQFSVTVSLAMLKEIGANYILSTRDLTGYSGAEAKVKLICAADGYRIYKLY